MHSTVRFGSIVLILFAGLSGTARAATITHSGSVLTYNAGAGETNNVSFTLGTADYSCGTRPAPCLDVQEAGEAAITAFPADRCADDGFGTVECDVPTSIVANLGDRNDALFDWAGPSTINGEGGNETALNGNGGADTINGGAGNDALFGGEGNDTLNGGDGDDFLEGFGGLSPTDPGTTGGTDVYVGGPGKDFVDYADRSEALSVSLDGVANDGAAGEADDVRPDVEQVRGGTGADRLTGDAGPNWLDGWGGNDTVRGGPGDDTLFGGLGDDSTAGDDGQDTIEGGDGNDSVDGGSGIDTMYGDEFQICIPSDCATGRDTLIARDGVDDAVRCGPGEDVATLDAGDTIPTSGQDVCERADRSAAGGGGSTSSESSGGGGAGPGTDGGGGSGADLIVPTLSALRLGTLRRGRSVILRYTLSEAATVTFRAERAVKRRGRTRWVKVRGSIRHAGRAGANRFGFAGRFGGRRLNPGAYRLVAVARDAAGNQARAARRAFRVAG